MSLAYNVAAVFIGGGAGSVLRYAVQFLMAGRATAGSMPWATFTVNIVGCFLIGLFYSLSARLGWSTETRLLLTTGLCGGFTTFSTFSNESLMLMRQGHTATAAAYVAASVVPGIMAAFAGGAAGNWRF